QSLLFVAGAAPLNYQAQYGTRKIASAYAEERVSTTMQSLDANDLIYQLDGARHYKPWPKGEADPAPVSWVNSAGDFINPRNFDFPAQAVRGMPNAKFRMIEE